MGKSWPGQKMGVCAKKPDRFLKHSLSPIIQCRLFFLWSCIISTAISYWFLAFYECVIH